MTVPADGTPAKPVRLRYGYVIVPTSFEKDESGRVTAVHAEYLPETRARSRGSMSVKTKATIHWLDAKTAVPAEIRVYDRLFNVPHPDEGEGSFLDRLTPDSKTVLSSYVEPQPLRPLVTTSSSSSATAISWLIVRITRLKSLSSIWPSA